MSSVELISQQWRNGALVQKGFGEAFYIVTAYGMLGLGTDETSKLQTIVDDANEKGRTAIFFPHGTYYVTGITGDEDMHYFGDNATFIGGYGKEIVQIGAKPDSQVNVKDYGAKGDGITDDTAEVQAAITYMATRGGVLFFPKGSYLITSTLVIPANSWGINLVGEGVQTLLTLGFAGDLITFESIGSGLTLNHHRFYNIGFNGNNKASGKLVHVKCTSSFVIEHCFFFNSTTAGDFIYVQGNPTSLDSCHDVNIRDNYFDSSGLSGRSAIYLESTAADIQISGNYMELRHTVDYCLYLNDCGSLQVFDNHIYNSKINIVKINGANGKTYMFDNNFLDYSLNDLINIDGTSTVVANGAITFINCIMMGLQSGYSAFHLVNNVYGVRIADCIFTIPSVGSRSAIRAGTPANVNDIYIENNTFNTPANYANGVIEDIFGFRCVIQNNYGYKKTISVPSWLSLNAWGVFPEQCSGLLYLGLYTTDAVDGAIIIHYREGATGTDFTIFTGTVSAATTTSSPNLIVVPVSPEANILINGATNVAIQSKVFVPFNV